MPIEGLRPVITNYLKHVEKAGKEIAAGTKLSEVTKKALEQNFIPDEIYIQEVNRSFDTQLKK